MKKASLKTHLHRQVKLAVVPHKANHYRPHLVRRVGLALILLAVVGLNAGYNAKTTGTVLGDKANITIDALAQATNDAREQNSLRPLIVDQKLNQAAYLKAKDMFAKQYWAHVAPDGAQPWRWFADADYNYSVAGENLAKNFYTVESTTDAWMSSSEHRANILGQDYTEVGFAVMSGSLQGKETTIVVALYAAPAVSVAGAQDVAPAAVAIARPPGGVVSQFGVIMQSLSPAATGSIVLLMIAGLVAFTAHLYRNKLPKSLRQSWYRHHGAYKMAGLASIIVVVATVYSGGQI